MTMVVREEIGDSGVSHKLMIHEKQGGLGGGGSRSGSRGGRTSEVQQLRLTIGAEHEGAIAISADSGGFRNLDAHSGRGRQEGEAATLRALLPDLGELLKTIGGTARAEGRIGIQSGGGVFDRLPTIGPDDKLGGGG